MGIVLNNNAKLSYGLDGPHHLNSLCCEQEEELLLWGRPTSTTGYNSWQRCASGSTAAFLSFFIDSQAGLRWKRP